MNFRVLCSKIKSVNASKIAVFVNIYFHFRYIFSKFKQYFKNKKQRKLGKLPHLSLLIFYGLNSF